MSVTSKIPNVVFLGLLGLLSLCLLSGFGTAETIVDTDPHVVLEVGTRSILPCRIQRKAYSVEWKRQLSSETELLVSLDPFFIVGERDGPGYEAGLFNITDNYSLVIKDVKVQDEGLYMCSFSDYRTGKAFRNSTRVSVQAFPDEPFPVIQECIGKDVNLGVCTLVAHATSNLTCFVKGYYPDIDLFFLHGSEKLTSIEYEEWYNADGTKNKDTTIQVSVSDEPYECVASRLPVIGGNRSVTVIVKAHYQGPNAAAIVVPVIMVVLGCLTIIFRCHPGNSRATTGPISKFELWIFVTEAEKNDDFEKLREAICRLRSFPKPATSKLEKVDDFFKSLCEWKSETSNANQRIKFFSACYGVGMSDIASKVIDRTMLTPCDVSSNEIEHILWKLEDTRKITELLEALELNRDAVDTAVASGRGKEEVVQMAREELLKWQQRKFDVNPMVILNLKLDDLQCETNFSKIQTIMNEEIDEEEMKDICCKIFEKHHKYLVEAIRDHQGEDLRPKFREFVDENNGSLFNTLKMLRDWVRDEECSNCEKRNKLLKAVEAAQQADHSDAKWPPDDDLRIIASFLSPASMGPLCFKLGVKSPPQEASQQERFKALTEWRDHASSKGLKEKHTELSIALREVKLEDLIPRFKGQLIYKTELVDLAFQLFLQDLFYFTESLGISAAKLVTYKSSFQPAYMTLGTIGLVCKLFQTGKRSHFLEIIKGMPYPYVLASGMLGLDFSFEEMCAISLGHVGHDISQKQPNRTYSSCSLSKYMDGTCSEYAQQLSHEAGNDLQPMLTSASEVKDLNKVSPESSDFIENFKLWRKQLRKTPVNFRLAIAYHLRMKVKPYLISQFLRGKETPFTVFLVHCTGNSFGLCNVTEIRWSDGYCAQLFQSNLGTLFSISADIVTRG